MMGGEREEGPFCKAEGREAADSGHWSESVKVRCEIRVKTGLQSSLFLLHL